MASVRGDIRVLGLVVKRLHALTTTGPAGASCAVRDEAKEAVRLYVESWITPYVEAVLADLEGAKRLPQWMIDSARRA